MVCIRVRTRIHTIISTHYRGSTCWQRPLVSPLHLSACISSCFWDNVIFICTHVPVGTMVLVRTRVPYEKKVPWYHWYQLVWYSSTSTEVYHGTRVPWYTSVEVLEYHTNWYQWYHGTFFSYGTRVRTSTMVPTGTCVQINITLSQKQLEIQALRCNGDTSGRCQHVLPR